MPIAALVVHVHIINMQINSFLMLYVSLTFLKVMIPKRKKAFSQKLMIMIIVRDILAWRES
jgi:hypothetical protein